MSTPLPESEKPVPFHSGMARRRFKTPDFDSPVPDRLWLADGSSVVNPEWEEAQYEEFFFDKKKRPLKAATLYGAVQEMNPTTHIKADGNTVERHPSEIEREKRECAYMLRVVWPEICGGEGS